MKMILVLVFFSTSLYAREVEVLMKSITFEPKVITIAVGDTVRWKNVAVTDHSASGPVFNTGLVPPKVISDPVLFSKAGTFSYNCKIHGNAMKGTIIVGAK